MLFDQDELEAWLKQGRVVEVKASTPQAIAATNGPERSLGIVDISSPPIYHRSARYR